MPIGFLERARGDKGAAAANAAWRRSARRGMAWDCAIIAAGLVAIALGLIFGFGAWIAWLCAAVGLIRAAWVVLGRGGFWIRKPDVEWLSPDIGETIIEAWRDARSARLALVVHIGFSLIIGVIGVFY